MKKAAGVRHSCWRWIAGLGIAFALLSVVAIRSLFVARATLIGQNKSATMAR
jgi:hypothetical protein